MTNPDPNTLPLGEIVEGASGPMRVVEYTFGEACQRCGGKGYLSHFAHVDNGRCFECGGRERRWTRRFFEPLSAAEIAEREAEKAEAEQMFADLRAMGLDWI